MPLGHQAGWSLGGLSIRDAPGSIDTVLRKHAAASQIQRMESDHGRVTDAIQEAHIV
jgi:hypothetical protein